MYFKFKDCDNNLNSEIADQINAAFEKSVDISNTYHGLRKINQGCIGKRTALFPSRKNKGMIAVESRLELAHALLLERNPLVVSYRTQALKIALSHNEWAYPDFLIKFQNTYAVHEIKPDRKFLSNHEQRRFHRLEQILLASNIDFKIIDQLDLFDEEEVLLILFFYQRAHLQDWSEYQIKLARNLFNNEKNLSLSDIYERIQTKGLPRELGDYLIFHNHIKNLKDNNFPKTLYCRGI
ncbi:TPA: endonuclease [Acinetobacter baumannii]|nr:endonuclease [Acinetobacter baumannii]